MPEGLYRTLIQPIEVDPDAPRKDRLPLLAPDDQLIAHIKKRYLHVINDMLRESSFKGQVSFRSFHKKNHEEKNNDKEHETKSTFESDTTSHGNPGSLSVNELIPHPKNAPFIDSLRRLKMQEHVIFIYGVPGVGKSALLNGIAQEIRSGNKKIPARYMDMEAFLTEFTNAVRKKDILPWRKDLRQNRLLIIDNFQFIKPKAIRSQEEIRNLMDEFQETGHKLVLSSDRPLNELNLGSDLKSRLQLSRQETMLIPDEDGRKSILLRELDRFGFTLGEDLLEHLAYQIDSDVRRLLSVVRRLHLYRTQNPDVVWSLDLLDSLGEDLYSQCGIITPEKVLKTTALYFGISPESILGPARDRKYTLPRQLVAYLLSDIFQMKLIDIAAFINRKDHVTVIHAKNRVEEYMAHDLFFKSQVEDIRRLLRRIR